MIIDRSWNKLKKCLTVSYVDESGHRKIWNKYINYIKTYEYDENGKYDTWDNKKCSLVYKDTSEYVPNEFDILELLYDLDKTEPELLKQFHAQNFPKIYTWDIEVEASNEFPYADKALHKILSLSLVGPDLSCIVFGLQNLSEASIELFRNRYLTWIDNNQFASELLKSKNIKPKVFYRSFNSEGDLLYHFFTKVLPHIGVLSGWNSTAYDWQYITNRAKNIFGYDAMIKMISDASPINEVEWLKYVDMNEIVTMMPGPKHCLLCDEMELVKKYDYQLRPYESYSLNWVGDKAVGAKKITYEGTIQELYNRDPEWYYFYNAIDSLITMLIHCRLKCLESPAALSSVTLCGFNKSLGQVATTTANIFYEFYLDNKHVVYKKKNIGEQKQYKGAFCACVPGFFNYNVCLDFASLYPSQIRTCNLSFSGYVPHYTNGVETPWLDYELEEFKNNPNYFVTLNNCVYKNDKDYEFKKMQTRFMNMRAKYKYRGQQIDSELLPYIESLINNYTDNKKE